MRSEEEERPRFVTGGYGRHRRQWVKSIFGPRTAEIILKITHAFKCPKVGLMSSKQIKILFSNCLSCLVAKLAKVATLVM